MAFPEARPRASGSMLILTRRPGESLCLGDDIKITILGFQGKQVKVGLEVPADMVVYRDEVRRRALRENRLAMAVSNTDLLAAAQLWQHEKK